jgi:hypothetical protein
MEFLRATIALSLLTLCCSSPCSNRLSEANDVMALLLYYPIQMGLPLQGRTRETQLIEEELQLLSVEP